MTYSKKLIYKTLIFILLASLALLTSSLNVVSACEEVKNPQIKIGKLIDQPYSHCDYIFITYPKQMDQTNSRTAKLTGDFGHDHVFEVKLKAINSFGQTNTNTVSSHFCLSKKALEKSMIIIEYWHYKIEEKPHDCSKKITLNDLSGLLNEQ